VHAICGHQQKLRSGLTWPLEKSPLFERPFSERLLVERIKAVLCRSLDRTFFLLPVPPPSVP
jgi:hypothetical protein